MRPKSFGFSLVELLVVIAIVAVLGAIAFPHYSRALRMAKQVAGDEAKRQDMLAKNVDGGRTLQDFLGAATPEELRARARAEFRRPLDAGRFDIFITRPLFVVTTEDEFRAYYHTLIAAESGGPIDFDRNRHLIARTPEGHEYLLPLADDEIIPGDRFPYPLSWDFISTNLGDTSLGLNGTNVLRSNGEQAFITYPYAFPATPVVAELGRQFVASFDR